MALDATRRGVLTGERERGLRRVIEGSSGPIGGGVAELAVLREPGSRMVRIGGALVVLQVARIASCGQSGVLAAGVALCAGSGGVCASQRKLCRAVVKGGGHPCRCSVAELAILWESGGRVVGSGRSLKILQVA